MYIQKSSGEKYGGNNPYGGRSLGIKFGIMMIAILLLNDSANASNVSSLTIDQLPPEVKENVTLYSSGAYSATNLKVGEYEKYISIIPSTVGNFWDIIGAIATAITDGIDEWVADTLKRETGIAISESAGGEVAGRAFSLGYDYYSLFKDCKSVEKTSCALSIAAMIGSDVGHDLDERIDEAFRFYDYPVSGDLDIIMLYTDGMFNDYEKEPGKVYIIHDNGTRTYYKNPNTGKFVFYNQSIFRSELYYIIEPYLIGLVDSGSSGQDQIDYDGNYDLLWSSSLKNFRTRIEESPTTDFINPSYISYTTDRIYHINNQLDGTYYYRVKSCDDLICSNWSNIIRIVVSHPPPSDNEKPSLTITNPSNGQTFTNPTITVSGTASDNVGVSKVEIRVGIGNWQTASGTTSWSKTLNLASGSNMIYARATDTSGNIQETNEIVYYNTITIPNLFYSVYESPDPVSSYGSSMVTVYASRDIGGLPIENAEVLLFTSPGGSLDPDRGYTDVNGYFKSIYTPPVVSTSTQYWIQASVSKPGYTSLWTSVSDQITVNPPSNDPLYVQVYEYPDPVTAGGTSYVDVYVHAWNGLVPGASVCVSANGGTLTPECGVTDSRSHFNSIYTAPVITASQQFTINATASKGGYANGKGFDLINVNPPNDPPIEPNNPSPTDGADDQSLDTTLNWNGGDPDSGDTVTYTVFLDADPNPTTQKCVGTSLSCVVSGLSQSTTYYWKVMASDGKASPISGKIWNFTTQAPPPGDTTPPTSIKALINTSFEPNYINWSWIDPDDSDFSKVMIYIDGLFQKNVSKGYQSYTASGLTGSADYTISTRTVDTSGNMNQTWLTHIARTAEEQETLLSPVQEQWNKSYGGTNYDTAFSVNQTSDGGYIIAGQTKIDAAGNYDALLVRTNADGVELWNKTFGGSGWDDAKSVQQTVDGGYIFAGTYHYDEFSYYNDAWLIKTDSNGVQQWSRPFGIAGDDSANSVQQTADGGYIVAGKAGANGDVLLIKTNSDGIQQWIKNFGGSTADGEAYSVRQTSDGGYVLAGMRWGWGGGDTIRGLWLIKTDSNGNEQWNRVFGGQNDLARSVRQTFDGGFIISGYTSKYGAGGYDVWLIKTDSSGFEQWNRTFGGSNGDIAYSVQQATDGGYFIEASTNSNIANGNGAWLIKTDATGHELWNKTFGGSAASGQQTSDGGFILAGEKGGDMWLVKVSKEDRTPPVLTFISPTPANMGVTAQDWVFINMNASESLSKALLEWNGINETMSSLAYDWHKNKTSLRNGVYEYRVWGEDRAGYWNVSETRSLTIAQNNPPNVPSNPSPANGAIDQSISPTLSWTGGDPDTGDAVIYIVYLDTSSSPTTLKCSSTSLSCNPGTLNYNT